MLFREAVASGCATGVPGCRGERHGAMAEEKSDDEPTAAQGPVRPRSRYVDGGVAESWWAWRFFFIRRRQPASLLIVEQTAFGCRIRRPREEWFWS